MINKEGKSSEHPNIALFDLHPSVRMKTVQGHDIETDNVCIYISDIYSCEQMKLNRGYNHAQVERFLTYMA